MATHLAILHIFLLAVTFGGSSAYNMSDHVQFRKALSKADNAGCVIQFYRDWTNLGSTSGQERECLEVTSFICNFSSRKELRTKETNQDQIIQLSHPVQPKNIDPSQVIQMSWQPRVFLYRGFLSEEECDYLISWVHGKKSYTMLRGDDSPMVDTNDIRDDLGISVDSDDEIARRIEERISAWTFLPKQNSKSLTVLHFGPEASKQNYHYFDNKYVEEVGEPVMATVILYLSNVSQGGQLLFPQSKSGIWTDCTKSSSIFRHSRGDAIVFFNLHLNATPDRSSRHARCPVIQGDLWFATKFFYLKSISTTKDLARSDDADCTDEDENCPDWAAVGECQKNSVFMIGSPDYYGTCRKSCNAC